ncbi:hypothetical protein [Actinacidiphila yanglinensis]|nr:hypothetical protein [Actinacidiphila yanglinensis]
MQKLSQAVPDAISAGASAQQKADTEALQHQLQQQGGVLGMFNTTDRYGVPINVYTINPDEGGWSDWQLKIYGFLIELCFMATKWAIAFSVWLITWALGFGLAQILLAPVLNVAYALHAQVIVTLGLPMLCLTIAGTVCAFHILIGDRSRGVGELALSVLIAGIYTTILVSPTTQLMGSYGGNGGLLAAAKGFSLEVTSVIIDAGQDPTGATSSTDTKVTGSSPTALTDPIKNALVDALITKPAELLEYGQSFDGDCAQEYADSKLAQLAYDQRSDDVIHFIQDTDSISDIPGLSAVSAVTGPDDWVVDKVVGIAGGWMQDHYGHPPMDSFENDCVRGDVGAAKKASVDKVAGAFFVLLAGVFVAVFVCRLAASFLIAQCRIALESIRGEGVLVVGVMPGGGRSVLWKWCATLLQVFQTLIMSVVMLGVFLVIITTLLGPDLDQQFQEQGGLALRFLVLDIVCAGMFVYRKKIAASARRSGANLRSRLEGGRVGGTGRAVFRAAPSKEESSRRSGAARAAVMLGALALSGGTSTTLLGGGRTLARRINAAGRTTARPRPAPVRVPRQRPGRPGMPPPPPAPPVPPAPSGPAPAGSATLTRPTLAPRARRTPPPRHPSMGAANSTRQAALRRRLDRQRGLRPPPGATRPPSAPGPGPGSAS